MLPDTIRRPFWLKAMEDTRRGSGMSSNIICCESGLGQVEVWVLAPIAVLHDGAHRCTV